MPATKVNSQNMTIANSSDTSTTATSSSNSNKLMCKNTNCEKVNQTKKIASNTNFPTWSTSSLAGCLSTSQHQNHLFNSNSHPQQQQHLHQPSTVFQHLAGKKIIQEKLNQIFLPPNTSASILASFVSSHDHHQLANASTSNHNSSQTKSSHLGSSHLLNRSYTMNLHDRHKFAPNVASFNRGGNARQSLTTHNPYDKLFINRNANLKHRNQQASQAEYSELPSNIKFSVPATSNFAHFSNSNTKSRADATSFLSSSFDDTMLDSAHGILKSNKEKLDSISDESFENDKHFSPTRGTINEPNNNNNNNNNISSVSEHEQNDCICCVAAKMTRQVAFHTRKYILDNGYLIFLPEIYYRIALQSTVDKLLEILLKKNI